MWVKPKILNVGMACQDAQLTAKEESSFIRSGRHHRGFPKMARGFGIICRASLASMCLVSTLVLGQTAQHRSKSAGHLVKQFKSETVFWKQFEVAKKLSRFTIRACFKTSNRGSATRI